MTPPQITLMLAFIPITMAMLQLTNTNTIQTQTYIVHLDSTNPPSFTHDSLTSWLTNSLAQHTHDQSISSQPAPTPEIIYSYQSALTGFAVKLTATQAQALQQQQGVVMMYPDTMQELHTTHTAEFMGLKEGKGLWSEENLAADVVIGLVDTGIWPEHVSFGDEGLGEVPKRWKGRCEEGTRFGGGNCNRKIIGGRAFWKGYETLVGEA